MSKYKTCCVRTLLFAAWQISPSPFFSKEVTVMLSKLLPCACSTCWDNKFAISHSITFSSTILLSTSWHRETDRRLTWKEWKKLLLEVELCIFRRFRFIDCVARSSISTIWIQLFQYHKSVFCDYVVVFSSISYNGLYCHVSVFWNYPMAFSSYKLLRFSLGIMYWHFLHVRCISYTAMSQF
jgi:hypothetical protein